MPQELVGLFLYLALMLAIGFWVSLRIRSETDYLVAGRSMGMTLVTFSIFATWFGAEAVLSTAGAVYSEGLRGAAVDPFGYVAALFGAGLIFAAALWRRGYTTFIDFFRDRYGRGVERLAVLIMVPASIPWAAVQIRAFGQVLSTTANIDLDVAILCAAGVVAIYTLLGGLLADAITDLIQGFALIVGLILIFLTVQSELGGFRASLVDIGPERLKLFGGHGTGLLDDFEYWAIPVMGGMVTTEVVQRMLGARSADVARRGTLAGATLYLAVAFIPIYLGLVGARLIPELDDPERLVPALAERYLGPISYIVFSGALVSIILSTVDSILLSNGGVISHNLVVPLIPSISGRGRLIAARVGVLAMAIIATLVALRAERMFDLIHLGAQAGSAGIFVVVCFGLFTKRGGAWSAGTALASSMAVWATGYVAGLAAPFLASLATAVLVYLLVSRLRTVPRTELNKTG